ncbi:hypothetical protein CfE428DRAFT_3078 [Chthoniobacter flavus Ellin428]|uniref:Uncharacterized protein n=2 Tax=Chthoniobacter flavus TaxID=191863 RepID=B4D2F3_9BACT|nr:hypothetical protein [Chthoniobacter flavus]EDY19393.1 hypothetical protein CfE428DRAFT_3078 [Chthoniobacter flavus Ellin428]TCO90481.1 hypothetical protein EV701_110104 [Chthoniobacter flavus]
MAFSEPLSRAGKAETSHPNEGRRFVVVWCFTVVMAVLILYPLATCFLINWFNDGGLRWIKEIRTRKFQMAEMVRSKERILIAGGSSGLFGVDAELLEKRLRRPVVNLASHAGLGLRFLLDDARQAARPGDTVLLNIEYGLYASGPLLTDIERPYCWTYEPGRLFHLPLTTLRQQLYGIPSSDYVRSWKLWNLRFSGGLERSEPAVWTEYSFVQLGPRGDFRGEVHPTAPIAEIYLESTPGLSSTSAQLLEDFFSWAAHRDIQVVGLFPPVVRGPKGPKAAAPVFERIRSFYQAHHLTVLGDPDVVQMPRALFLDTSFHTNKVGRRLHTEILAQELQAHFNQGRPPGKPGIFLLCDPYSKAGPKDDSLEFTACRYLSMAPLQHSLCMTPAQVREMVQKGTLFYYDDSGIGPMLQVQGLQSVVENRHTSTLADWVKMYPQHIFLLSICGGAKVPNSSSELPASFSKFLNDEAPMRAAILGTGSFSGIKRIASGTGFVKVRRSTRVRLPRTAPLEYLAAAWPASEDHPDTRRLMVERESILDSTADGDLAVCVVDPNLGIVVQRDTFHDGVHVDEELRRVVAQ